MHITLTAQQEAWIKSVIDSGHYASTSEVMRHAIRLLQDEENTRKAKLETLKEAVQKGIGEIKRDEFSKKSISDLISSTKRRRA